MPKVHVVFEEWPRGERTLLWKLTRAVARMHVLAIVEKDGLLVVFNSDSNGVRFDVFGADELTDLIELIGPMYVVTVHMPEVTHPQVSWLEPISCVTMVKRLIGLRDWRVQTPRQLLRRLQDG